jgi:hypothetical protein
MSTSDAQKSAQREFHFHPRWRFPPNFGLPEYPIGEVVGPCVCGSWPGGECFKCPLVPCSTENEDG